MQPCPVVPVPEPVPASWFSRDLDLVFQFGKHLTAAAKVGGTFISESAGINSLTLGGILQ